MLSKLFLELFLLLPVALAKWKYPPQGVGCCEDECFFGSDDFNRSNSTNLGSDWTEVTGNSEIASNELLLPFSAVAVHNTVNPSGNGNMNVFADVTLGSGDVARVVAGYADTNNYLIAEVTEGSPGTIKLIERVSGTETTLVSQSENITGSITFGCCVTGLKGYASYVGRDPNLVQTADVSASFMGDQAGVATTSANAMAYDNFFAREQSTDCGFCTIGEDTSFTTCCNEGGDKSIPMLCRLTIPAGNHAELVGTHFMELYNIDSVSFVCAWGEDGEQHPVATVGKCTCEHRTGLNPTRFRCLTSDILFPVKEGTIAGNSCTKTETTLTAPCRS